MDKLISSNFAIDYSIFVHDSGMTSILEFYHFEKDLINDPIVAIQYFGKSFSGKKERYTQDQDIFEFDEKNLCNFVNKLDEFIRTDGYPKNTYLAKSSAANSPAIHIQKISNTEYVLSRSNNIYDALDKKYNWCFNLTNKQLIQLIDQLSLLKNKILEKSCKNI